MLNWATPVIYEKMSNLSDINILKNTSSTKKLVDGLVVYNYDINKNDMDSYTADVTTDDDYKAWVVMQTLELPGLSKYKRTQVLMDESQKKKQRHH